MAAAFAVTGAGSPDANGLYLPSDKTWYDVPIFTNDRSCALSREPHRRAKTDLKEFGWILGIPQERRALYAVRTDDLAPPVAASWRRLAGELPVPKVVDCAEDTAGAAADFAEAWKKQAELYLAARMYEEAESWWTRAISLEPHLLQRQEHADLRVLLRVSRAEGRLRLRRWADALSDAEAALSLRPDDERALQRGAAAAAELRRWSLAEELLRRLQAGHPEHPEALRLLAELRAREEKERQPQGDMAVSAGQKLQASPQREAVVSHVPRKLAAQYALGNATTFASSRREVEEEKPLSSLPYHQMGLPSEQVELMDKFFTEMRDKRKASSRGKHGSQQDRRSAKERELDREEADERRRVDRRVLADLLALKRGGGEPRSLEQAPTELYCFWTLPIEVSGKECKVEVSSAGSWLTVTARGVVIFDQRLFHQVKADDAVWSVDSGELRLTLTKAEKDKLWEQLGEVSEIARDERGEVIPETVPAPMSAADRLAKFKQMLDGDDRSQVGFFDHLKPAEQRFVQAVRTYRHALATGNDSLLAEAEEDLEDFGRLVV